MKRILVVLSLLCYVLTDSAAQTVITLTGDTVYDEPLIIDEDTIIEGVGKPTVTFNGNPKIIVKSANFLIKNVALADKMDLISLDGENSLAEWYNIGMCGFMTNIPSYQGDVRIDGSVPE